VTACAEGASGSPEQQVNAGAVIYVVLSGWKVGDPAQTWGAYLTVEGAEKAIGFFELLDPQHQRVDVSKDREHVVAQWSNPNEYVWIERWSVEP
jgi:hypothetical protein